MSAASGISTNRADLYSALTRRNKFVSRLRIGVPIFGALVLIALLGQLIASNIANQFLPDGVHIERDNLVISTPTYSGVMQDGTLYTVTSKVAEAALENPDIIDLETARIDLKRPSGQEIVGETDRAAFSLSSQQIKVDGILHVSESGGTVARLRNSVFDWSAQTMDTLDNVELTFVDGSVLTAGSLHFDTETEEWDFRLVKLIVSQGAAP